MPVLRAADVGKVLLKGGRARVDEPVPPRFKAGDAVRTRNINPLGHTRLPRYARGRQGVIDRDHGVFVFPDTHAMGQGPKPQHCYAVRFTARELWGPDASARDEICAEHGFDPLSHRFQIFGISPEARALKQAGPTPPK